VPTAEPAASAAPIGEDAGRGDVVLRIEGQELPTVAVITHQGKNTNFAVTSYIGTEYNALLVNEIGNYSGMVYVAPLVDTLEITAGGDWTVTRYNLDGATQWDGLTDLAGEGDSVVVLTGGSSGAVAITNQSESNFSIVAYDEFGEYLDLLVNEIGDYSGEVLLPDADPMALDITAVGGTWTMSAIH